jgi:predicted DNA binding CopG/RHH family protein
MAKVPVFTSEQEESEFWDTHDSTDFFEDTKEVNKRLSGPRPRKTLISLRLDQETIEGLKALASEQGIGYQTLLRAWVTERLMVERASGDAHTDNKDKVLIVSSGQTDS